MDYETELRKMLDLDSRTVTDWEDYRMFMLGISHNRLNSESRLQSALYMVLKELEKVREENRKEIIYNTVPVDGLQLDDHYEDLRKGKKIAYKEEITKERVLRALKNNNGSRVLAAKELGCSVKTIYNRLKS
ncbi:MAG: Bacterial regulatory protein Fis family [Herbinix sp.]|jgi:transcriptional regulator with PAS, ATPase and Fis domain|nr:Bacterial regulatory protein Fis family [Herbinix sp.]